MNQKLSNFQASFNSIITLIFVVTLARIASSAFINYLPNFSTVNATALFCGAYFIRKRMAYLIILSSVFLGDIAISKIYYNHWSIFYSGFYWQYIAYLLITTLGMTLTHSSRRINITVIASTSLIASLLFFVISNFGVWCGGYLYPLTLEGLVTCYIAAIPFFKNTLLSDLFFSLSLFLTFKLMQEVGQRSANKNAVFAKANSKLLNK